MLTILKFNYQFHEYLMPKPSNKHVTSKYVTFNDLYSCNNIKKKSNLVN